MKERIERLRRELGCTNRDIAEVLGVNHTTLTSYIGKNRSCPQSIILRISIIESHLGFCPMRNNFIICRGLAKNTLRIARETIAGVNHLKQLDAMRRRAL